MTDIKFDPGTNLGDEIIKMNRQELCELVSRLCARIKAETGTRNYRGGVYPENISINSAGEIQLGLARNEGWEGQELEFLAPELYWNSKRTQASDVYSLGMLLYYALNKGRLPFEGQCENPQLKRMNGDKFPMPKAAGRRLSEIIQKATAFKPEGRYSNVEELQIMLDNCVNNQYLGGEPGAKAIFNKEEGELSEIERMMVGIIENGEEEIPEEEEAPAEQETTAEPEAAAEAESDTQKKDPEAENKSSEATKPQKTEEPEKVKVYEPVKKKKPVKSAKPAPKREPVPILTEEKNPELEPVILRNKNVQPAVQYGRSDEREKNIAEQMKKRRNHRLVSVLVICAVIVITAILVNKLLKDMSWDKDGQDNQISIQDDLPTIGSEQTPGIGIMPTPEPPAETPEPTPSPEPVKESTYQLFMEDVSWTEARDKCIEMGGYLVVINDEAELEKVKDLAVAGGLERIWIGCHRINNTLVWENGETVDFYPAPWGQEGHEPSYKDTDGTAEDYLMLWNNNGWSYNDSRNDPAADYPQFYSGTIGYICEFTNWN